MKGLMIAGLALAFVPFMAEAQGGGGAFQGYNPTRCVVAARVMDGMARRAYKDTAAFVPGVDTLTTIAADSTRYCQTVFGNATTRPPEVLDFARTQWYTHQDSAAMATARRHMGTMANRAPGERAWELYLIATDALDGHPARIDYADATIKELDAIGSPAASVRVLAHYARANTAWSRNDDATVLKETQASLKAWRELNPETQLWRADVLAQVFLLQAHLAAFTKGGPAALAIIDTARGTLPRAAQMARWYIERAGRMYPLMGKTAAPLEAAYWYNVGTDGTQRPTKGKVALLAIPYRPCTYTCPPMLRTLKRFDKQYRDRGLQITLYTQTMGFYVDTAPASPFDEARYDSTYFVSELKIPGALAVFETQYTWKPDGRRENAATANGMNYPNALFVIVDRRGTVRYVSGNWQSSLEKRYADLIDRLLKEDAAPAAGAP